ncbi:CHAT domain-containing protein [Suillus cothurnatus]|nr:CHAT domain-containing protein [Suillus cothurnatus]
MSFFTSITQILPLILVSNLNSQRLLQLYQRLSCRTALDNTCSTAYTLSLISPSQPNLPLIPSTLRLLLPLILSLSNSDAACLVSGKNLRIPSQRIPAGIHVSINVDSRRRWKSALKVLSSEESVVWGDTVTISSRASHAFSVEIRASYEADRMLGNGELIGKLQMSWDELLNHGDEPFDISFPPVRDVHPSLTLKIAVVHVCDNQDGALSNSLLDSKIARDTDAGHAQFVEYVTSENISHLNAAVEHFQLVLDQCLVSHPDHAAALTNLAWARLGGFIRNDLEDIDVTTSLFRDALALRPQHHIDYPSSLFNLTEALTWRHIKKSPTADIREAAHLYRELLPLCPNGTYLRSIAAGPNGVEYVIGGCNNLPIDTSDEGIHLRRVVLELCPLGHQLCHDALHWLAKAVEACFIQCGSIDDIDEAIQLHREAVSLCPEGHADYDTHLNNLALSLVSCFDHQGKPNDLDEAISLYEEALRLCPVGHESRDFSLDSLGGALVTCFNTRGCHVTLRNLSSALCSRFTQTEENQDVQEAITLCQESLEALSSLHPDRHYSYFTLWQAYMSRHCMQHKPADLALAVENFRLGSRHPTHGFPSRIIEAYKWTVAAEEHGHRSALEAYSTFFELLDAHLATQSLATSRREAAASFHYARTLPVDAASCAIRCDDLRHAIELVEQGHGQQWSLASRLRTPVEDLESANPTLAHNYLELSKLVSNAAQNNSATITDRAAADRAETEYRRLTRQWEAVFLLPPLYEGLQAAACQGPVIILITSQYSCSAIIVLMSGDPHHVPLPSVTLAELTNLKDRFVRAIQHACIMGPKLYLAAILAEARAFNPKGDARKAKIHNKCEETQWNAVKRKETQWNAVKRKETQWNAGSEANREHSKYSDIVINGMRCTKELAGQWMDAPAMMRTKSRWNTKMRNRTPIPACRELSLYNDLIVLLRTVWDTIMLPIVNVLQHAFTSIPLHTAHPFKTNADGSKEPCLEDLYICSYTPTLSALVRSRQMMKKHVTLSFVTIGQGQPGAGKGKELLAVDSELELVHKLVPVIGNRTTISGNAATRAGALKALQQNTWVHLACHGKQDHMQPYHSHFIMRDEHLTLLDIMEKDIPHAEFAFLSACHTTVGDEEMPDEVIHLTAGLQFSGFKSVIGTLWEVDDSVAQHVVEAFYKNMFKDLKNGGVMDCMKAAWALNRAMHSVKTKVPLEQRMVFVHIGCASQADSHLSRRLAVGNILEGSNL